MRERGNADRWCRVVTYLWWQVHRRRRRRRTQLRDPRHRKSDNWFDFLSHSDDDDDVDWSTLHQDCWPNSKQTNHPLGGRYQPITREHSQMTSQSTSVPFLPKWLILIFLCISCRRSNTSSFHLFVLTDALACLTEGKTDWADLDLKFWEWQPLFILILPPNKYSTQKMLQIYCATYAFTTYKAVLEHQDILWCFEVCRVSSLHNAHEAYSGIVCWFQYWNIDDDCWIENQLILKVKGKIVENLWNLFHVFTLFLFDLHCSLSFRVLQSQGRWNMLWNRSTTALHSSPGSSSISSSMTPR